MISVFVKFCVCVCPLGSEHFHEMAPRSFSGFWKVAEIGYTIRSVFQGLISIIYLLTVTKIHFVKSFEIPLTIVTKICTVITVNYHLIEHLLYAKSVMNVFL